MTDTITSIAMDLLGKGAEPQVIDAIIASGMPKLVYGFMQLGNIGS